MLVLLLQLRQRSTWMHKNERTRIEKVNKSNTIYFFIKRSYRKSNDCKSLANKNSKLLKLVLFFHIKNVLKYLSHIVNNYSLVGVISIFLINILVFNFLNFVLYLYLLIINYFSFKGKLVKLWPNVYILNANTVFVWF